MARYRRRGGAFGEESSSEEENQQHEVAETPEQKKQEENQENQEAAKVVAGRRRRTMRLPKGKQFKAKTLKRVLKKAGLKTPGKKSTLRARARKAHLIRGGSLADRAASV